jgi:hypothetical protein
MQFINAKGELQEGTLLTDEQVSQRAAIVEYLHKAICGPFATHSDYSRRVDGIPRCEEIANFFVTKFELKLLPDVSLTKEAGKFDPQPAQPLPSPAIPKASEDGPFF